MRLDLTPSAVTLNDYMPVVTHRNDKIAPTAVSTTVYMSRHVRENEIMCDNNSSVTHFATYHISNSPFYALVSEQQVIHS